MSLTSWARDLVSEIYDTRYALLMARPDLLLFDPSAPIQNSTSLFPRQKPPTEPHICSHPETVASFQPPPESPVHTSPRASPSRKSPRVITTAAGRRLPPPGSFSMRLGSTKAMASPHAPSTASNGATLVAPTTTVAAVPTVSFSELARLRGAQRAVRRRAVPLPVVHSTERAGVAPPGDHSAGAGIPSVTQHFTGRSPLCSSLLGICGHHWLPFWLPRSAQTSSPLAATVMMPALAAAASAPARPPKLMKPVPSGAYEVCVRLARGSPIARHAGKASRCCVAQGRRAQRCRSSERWQYAR